MKKEKQNKSKREKLLKATELWYKKSLLQRPMTTMLISGVATPCDALTVFFTFDPLLQDAWYFTVLLTVTTAGVLDILPAFYDHAIEKIQYSRSPFEKRLHQAILGIAVGAWGATMLALCVVRYVAADFILNSLIQTSLVAEAEGIYTPAVTGALKFAIITFMNIVNVATSAAVLLSNHISFVPKYERDKQREATFRAKIEEEEAEQEGEHLQLSAIIDEFKPEEYEATRMADAIRKAKEEAKVKKAEAREALMIKHADSDVTESVIAQQRQNA